MCDAAVEGGGAVVLDVGDERLVPIADAEPEAQRAFFAVDRAPRCADRGSGAQIDVFELVLLEFAADVPAPGS